MKYYYKIYGLTLESDYEFHQFVKLEKIPDEGTDIRITYGGIRQNILSHIEQGHYVGFYADGMWFKNQAGLFWIHDKTEINFVEDEGKSIEDTAQFLPGMCLSILLWQRGNIVVHGSCLIWKGKTVVISGNNGAGKSTITTELINAGAKLLADDVTSVREENGIYMSYPAFPAQKLCADQIDKNGLDKERLRLVKYDLNKYEVQRNDVFCAEEKKIDAFYRIEINETDRLLKGAVTGADKLKVVVDSIFIKWMFNEYFRVQPEDLTRCIALANQIKIHRIIRPRDKDTLKEIIEYIDESYNPEKLTGEPWERWPPFDKSIPITVSPGFTAYIVDPTAVFKGFISGNTAFIFPMTSASSPARAASEAAGSMPACLLSSSSLTSFALGT